MTKPISSIRRDWVAKTLAGLLLGLVLALAGSGLFVHFASGIGSSVRVQLAMWLVMPVWLGVLGGSYFFHSGARAWLWLGAAAILLVGALASVRLL
ncbi:hypothetical protein [Rhodocyclus tenuis]|uniref:Uncharacterized protein n=1 Tax=Rhodocyclus tenuis TaxID=1066 RepID=A0A840G174_RHOTE|nr:hypothetical protein [Rhodocyclus tenuis]MBB4247994.1 hypothetical protein [Rhodocyclus tenuis]